MFSKCGSMRHSWSYFNPYSRFVFFCQQFGEAHRRKATEAKRCHGGNGAGDFKN